MLDNRVMPNGNKLQAKEGAEGGTNENVDQSEWKNIKEWLLKKLRKKQHLLERKKDKKVQLLGLRHGNWGYSNQKWPFDDPDQYK